MCQLALGDLDLAGGHAPLLGRRSNQHRARRGACLAKLIEGICNRAGATGALHGAEEQIVVERRIRRRERGPHLRPVGIELIGDDRREARGDALALVEMFDHHRDGVVRRDFYERVRHRRVLKSRGRRAFDAEVEVRADDERARGRGGRLQELTPRCRGRNRKYRGFRQHALALPQAKSLAAAWIAARMRT